MPYGQWADKSARRRAGARARQRETRRTPGADSQFRAARCSTSDAASSEATVLRVRLFAKSGRKRAEHMIHETLGVNDEIIIEVDRGWGDGGGDRYDFIATDAALYVYDRRSPGVAVRFSYDDLVSVKPTREHFTGEFRFMDGTGGLYAFNRVTRSKGALPRYVRDASERAHSS